VNLPDNAVTGARTDDVSSNGYHTVNRHGVARKSITDITPLSPVKNIDYSLRGSTEDFLVTLK
jgi:hypothetical protein